MAVLIVVQLERGDKILTLVQFALILTVASIPVAMPAVLSVTMAIGALALSKMKAIVTRLESIEEMAGIDILCSDKTGTLTQNQLTLGEPVTFGMKRSPGRHLCRLPGFQGGEPGCHRPGGHGRPIRIKTRSRPVICYKFIPFDPVHKRTEASLKDSQGNILQGHQRGAPGHSGPVQFGWRP